MAIQGWASGIFTIQKAELSAKFQALKRKIHWGGGGPKLGTDRSAAFFFMLRC
jgi:hypothetical protein